MWRKVQLLSVQEVMAQLQRLGIPAQSTKVEELEQFDHPFAVDFVDYAAHKVLKQKLEELERFCGTDDGRVHPMYDPFKVTCRFSTYYPNIQGAIKNPEFLSCIIAGDGKCWVLGDFSQHEIRNFCGGREGADDDGGPREGN